MGLMLQRYNKKTVDQGDVDQGDGSLICSPKTITENGSRQSASVFSCGV